MKINRKILSGILFVLLTSSILVSSSQLNSDDQNNRPIEHQEKSYYIENTKNTNDELKSNFNQLKNIHEPTLNINPQNQDISSTQEDDTQIVLETNNLYNHKPNFKLNSYLKLDNANAFLSIWNTAIAGLSNSTQITLPLIESGTYNFDVDWGDGNSDTISSWDQSEITHTYTTSGIYNLTITGTLDGWRFNNGGDRNKLLEIIQWGSFSFGNTNSHFYGANNLVLTATDAPDLSSTTSFYQTFRSCTNLGGDGSMNSWNTSTITTLERTFEGATNFNQSLDNWDTSKVTSLFKTFRNTGTFNQPLNNWNTSSVTTMGGIFDLAIAFNQPLNNWNTGNVVTMWALFFGATSFNQDIDSWDTSSVTTMYQMFRSATGFNQDLNNLDVSSVTTMYQMFYGATLFNQDLNDWDTSKVTNMQQMFQGATSFNGAIGDWDVSNVASPNQMFRNADAFNQPINNWDMSSATSLNQMFRSAKAFNQPLNGWDTSKVTQMNSLFFGATSFNQDISDWDTSKVTQMSDTFRSATSFNQPLNDWDTSKVTIMDSTFEWASAFNQHLDNWDLSSVTSIKDIFKNAGNFNRNITTWNTSSVTNMWSAFSEANSFNQDIGNWNTSKVTTMRNMFNGADNFNQDLNNWDTSQVTDFYGTFQSASSFNGDVGNWNTSQVTTLYQMFQGATSFNQDLNNWNTSQVTTLYQMFYGATLFDQDLNNWDTSSVTGMRQMFQGASSFNGAIGNWNTSSLTTIRSMFLNAESFNQDISNWDVSKVRDMHSTFQGAISFKYNISNWNVSSVTEMTNIFLNVKLDTLIYDQILIKWSQLELQISVTFHAGLSTYSIYSNSSRQYIIDTFGWSITDGGYYDNQAPDITSPDDLYILSGAIGYTLNWTVGDLEPHTYDLKINGSLVIEDISWDNGSIIYDIIELDAGVYLFEITLYDLFMLNTTDQVLVFVSETITFPSDLNLEYGFENTTIEWQLLNQNFTSYTLYLNQTLLQNVTENINDRISIDIFNLDIGVYVYTLLLNHSSGDIIQDTITITIQDTVAPTINYSSDITYPVGSVNQTIIYTLYDLRPHVYNVTLNGSTYIPTTSWENGVLMLNIDILNFGVYILIIQVYDLSFNMIYDEVKITVFDPNEISETSESSETTESSDSTDSSEIPASPFDIQDASLTLVIIIFVGGLVAGMLSQRRKVKVVINEK